MRLATTAALLGMAAVVVVIAAGCGSERPAPDVPVAPSVAPPAPTVAVSPVASASPGERQRPAATGGVDVIASALRAQAVVTGVVADVASIDLHGWRGTLRIDRVLAGSVRLGDTITIAWEELASARQVRFADGQRVLVVLDPLPVQSLWRKRFPAADRTGPVMVVAASGDAFLVRPDGITLDVLGHYLAMTPDARAAEPGLRRLAELVRGADPAIAREAFGLFASDPTRLDRLGADGAATLLAAARSAEREVSLRAAILRLAAASKLAGTRETALVSSAPGSPVRADALRALAALPDGLSADRAEALLADPDPELRAVGIEVASERLPRERAVSFVRSDPSPVVRLAAARVLLAREGADAIPAVIGLLDDPDAAVRSGIAEGIGVLGAPAVAPLRAVVDGESQRAAFAAVLGLSRAGREGGAMLVSLAHTHPSESVRAMANLALGKAPGHTH